MTLKVPIFIFVFILPILQAKEVEADDEAADSRSGKLLPIFQVVRFPNDVCTGTTRNGTCYTAEECSSKGGTNEGSCASGFGVCCVISLSCGGSATTNNSYIVQSSTTTSPATPCTYDICPCSTDICRIRYDFTTMVLATQLLDTADATGSVTQGAGTGDCVTDQFSITSPGANGSPVICGVNTDYHMIIDSDGVNCQKPQFFIGASTTTTRSWDIYVTQYTCGQEDEAGPPGCLQYFTGTGTHTVKNFGYYTGNTETATAGQDLATTHLSNQRYEICFRREAGYCYMCYFPWAVVDAKPQSFGLNSNQAMAEKNGFGSYCTDDYILIPGGTTSAEVTKTAITTTDHENRFCGGFLNSATTTTIASETVCTKTYPFRLGVVTDADEICTAAALPTCENKLSAATEPPGILGFAIEAYQVAC